MRGAAQVIYSHALPERCLCRLLRSLGVIPRYQPPQLLANVVLLRGHTTTTSFSEAAKLQRVCDLPICTDTVV